MAKLLAIVSYKIFPAHMGGQKGIVHFYEHLKHHHSVRLVVSYDNDAVQTSYPVERTLFANQRIWLNLFRLNRLRKMIRENGIDAMIAEHSYTGWMAWLLKKLTGKPFIIHSHNIEASRFRQMGKQGWKWYQPYEKWIHRKADFSFFKTEEEKQTALRQYSLSPSKCGVIPYGVDKRKIVADAQQTLRERYRISNQYIFYFNGTLDYTPNAQAVERIIDSINPLLQNAGVDYTILISGKRLSSELRHKIDQTTNIRYIEYVSELEMVYQGASLFLNPVLNNSGIKTKLVEALANNCTVISTRSGAAGIPSGICGNKLWITEDGDWPAFADAIKESIVQSSTEIPQAFYDYFSWEKIAEKAAGKMQEILNHA